MKWKHPHCYEGKKTENMFPLILTFRWRKFILIYDFSDFGLVFVVNLPHLFRFVEWMTVVTVEDSVEQAKKKRLNTNSVISRVGYTIRNIFEKVMASHSSTLAWKIPWTGEPGGLPSMGSHRVEHDWSNLAAAAARNIFVFRYWMCCNIT